MELINTKIKGNCERKFLGKTFPSYIKIVRQIKGNYEMD